MKRILEKYITTLLMLAVLGIFCWSTPSVADSLDKTGRYQIYFSPHARADIYLLDSATGRIWKPVTFTDVSGQPEIWINQTRIDSKEEFHRWLRSADIDKSK